MITIETLRKEISELHKALTRNGFEMRIERSASRTLELMACRMEIYKSICHRQAMIIEMQANTIRFEKMDVA